MDTLGQIAAFAAETPAAALPPEALDRTALILADTLGAIVGGAAEPEVAALTARHSGSGPALVIGTRQTCAPGTAALLNGTAGTTLEMDEGNQFSKGHPGIHTIPAALAVAPLAEVSGRAFLAAIAIGYEVGARVGRAATLRPAMHPHGTWGAIAAATAVARLQGAEAGQMRHAISLAASLGLSTSRKTMLEGGTVRNVFAGVSGQMGVLAGDLIAAGYTGDRDGVAEVFGRVVSDRFDAAAFTSDLGARWEVTRNYFKLHACCRFNHAALDALAEITRRAGGLSATDVARVRVESYGFAAEMNDPAPQNVLAAKFSVPFAVATTLVTGGTGVESFTLRQVETPAIQDLARRVEVVEDPAMTAQLPGKRPARVTVTLTSGAVLTAATETNRGDWADPYPVDALHGKYLSLTRRLWRADAAQTIWDSTLALAEAPRLAPFLADLAEAPA